MRTRRNLLASSLMIAFPSLLAAHVDGMDLRVSRGAIPSEVQLDWSGGQPTFRVYRATAPSNLITPAHLIGETQVRQSIDQPGSGGIFFYELTSDCQYNPPEICDGLDNDCNGAVDGPGSEISCHLPNAMSQCTGGSCGIAGCFTGFDDCNVSPADGCETNSHLAQSTSPPIYGGSTNADLKDGYTRVSSISNCGGCGVDCDDDNSCSTDLCVPVGPAGGQVGVCRHYGRAQCGEARCGGGFLPGTPPPLDPTCMGQDADGDGLPVEWEVPQTDPYTDSLNPSSGVDLDCDGVISVADDLVWHEPPAGDSTRDIYLEIRYMPGTGFLQDPVLGVIPEPFDHAPPVHPTTGVSAINEVQNAFSRQGISLHVDTSAPQPLPHAQLVYFPPSNPCGVDPGTGEPAVDFYSYKSDPANHDPRRRLGYHYVVSGHSTCGGQGETDGSGFAENFGNDLVVSLRSSPYYQVAPSGTFCASNSDCCPGCPSNPYTCTPPGVCVSLAHRVQRQREWAGTLMHELGHNLGLCHGGVGDPASSSCDDASANYAPNHISSMNYSFQLGWIFRAATAGTISPLDPSLPRRVDFSHGVESPLNEAALDETVGLDVTAAPFNRDLTRYFCLNGGYAAPSQGPIDWNCDGRIDPLVSADINNDGDELDILPSVNEWDALSLDFQCRPSVSN